MNEGLNGLEQHEDESLMTEFSIPLSGLNGWRIQHTSPERSLFFQWKINGVMTLRLIIKNDPFRKINNAKYMHRLKM